MSIDSQEYLRELCRVGFRKRLVLTPEQNKAYTDRVVYELGVIHDLGFDDYFLFIWDVIRFARTHDIMVGPGRGSVAGSLVAYLLEITEIDPIRFGLYFERFLNKDRVSPPDIDLDFEKHKRKYVFDYLSKRWGEDNVAHVATYSVLQTKQVIRDLGKVFEIDPAVIDSINDIFPFGCESIHDGLVEKSKDFFPFVKKYPRLFQVASKIEGAVRHSGKHAAGVIVGTQALSDLMPMMRDSKATLAQWDKKTLEDLGFLKADILGVNTLDIIHDTVRMIGGDPLAAMDLSDPVLLSEYREAHSFGTFQFETSSMMAALEKVKPNSFEELAAICALVRPGAKEHIDEFVKGRDTGEVSCFDEERLRPILGPTYGVILYQEQAMKVVQEIGGFSLSEADLIRRGIAKKEGIEQYREKFLVGAEAKGFNRQWATELFNILGEGSDYSFNKCLFSGTKVITSNGEKEIKDVFPGEEVLCFDGHDFLRTSVVKRHDNGFVPMVRLEFDDGSYET